VLVREIRGCFWAICQLLVARFDCPHGHASTVSRFDEGHVLWTCSACSRMRVLLELATFRSVKIRRSVATDLSIRVNRLNHSIRAKWIVRPPLKPLETSQWKRVQSISSLQSSWFLAHLAPHLPLSPCPILYHQRPEQICNHLWQSRGPPLPIPAESWVITGRSAPLQHSPLSHCKIQRTMEPRRTP